MGKKRISLLLAVIIIVANLIPIYAEVLSYDKGELNKNELVNALEESDDRESLNDEVEYEDIQLFGIEDSMENLVRVDNSRDLLDEIEKFNKEVEDKIIIIEKSIEFSESEIKDNSLIKITNRDNELTIQGEGNIVVSISEIRDELKGKVRLFEYGEIENILDYILKYDGEVTLKNITFDGNDSVAAVANYESSLVLENCNFINNYIAQMEKSREYGGGAAIFNARDILIKNTNNTKMEFLNNKSDVNGGAIYNTSGELEYKNASFWENQERNIGYNIPTISIDSDTKVEFRENTASNNSGAIYNDGNIEMKISDISFESNNSEYKGGAIYNTIETIDKHDYQGKVDFKDIGFKIASNGKILFYNNSSSDNGGAIYNGNDDETIDFRKIKNINFELKASEVEFKGNNSIDDGGAIYNSGSVQFEYKELENGLVEDIIVGQINTMFNIDADNIIFKENSSKENGGGLYNLVDLGDITILDYEDLPDNEKNFNLNAKNKIEFYKNQAESSGGAVYNSSYNGMGISSGQIVEFKENSSKENGGAISNSSYESSTKFSIDINGENIFFHKNQAESNGGAIYSEDIVTINAVEDIEFKENRSEENGGAINSNIEQNEISEFLGYKKLPETKIRNNGNLKFISNIAENNGGAINNVGIVDIETKGNIEFYKNYAEYNGGAISNDPENIDEKRYTEQPYEIKLNSLNGNILFEENGLHVDESDEINGTSNGGAIYNSGLLNIDAEIDIMLNKNHAWENGAAIDNGGENSTIASISNIKSKAGNIFINSNILGQKIDKEDIEDIEEVQEPMSGILNIGGEDASSNCKVNLESKNNIYFYNNINNDGSIINISGMQDYEYDNDYNEFYAKNPSDLINLNINSLNGRIYMIGNRTYNNYPIIYNYVEYGFYDYPEDIKEKFEEVNYNNILFNGKSFFKNNFREDSQDIKAESINHTFDEDKLIILVNGYDYLKNEDYNFAYNYLSNDNDEKKALEYLINMNDTLKILADDKESDAKLKGIDSEKEEIKLRFGINYFDDKSLKNEIETKGAEKTGYYLKGWKINKNLKTGLDEVNILTEDEFDNNIIIPINGVLEKLSKAKDDEEFCSILEKELVLSEFDILKNFHKYEGGLEVTAQWAEGEPVSKVKVIFDANGGKIGDKNKKEVIINKGYKVSPIQNPIREGYKFKGWKLSGKTNYFDFNIKITEDIILAASSEKDNPVDPITTNPSVVSPYRDNVDVIFDANEGVFKNSDTKKVVTIKRATKVNELNEKPTRYGYIFEGWKEKDKNSFFDFNETIYNDKILKASWKMEKLNKDDHYQYIYGYNDGTIRAEDNITREEVATVFFRLLTSDYRKEIYLEEDIFKDVLNERWSSVYISTLNNGKIIEGYPDGDFKPTKDITRAEIATMASRFDHLKKTDYNYFNDVKNHWAIEYINSAAKYGWIEGFNGEFRPDDSMTRAEFVTLINNMLDRKTNIDNMSGGRKEFKDLDKNKWYYKEIEEAANSHEYKIEKNEEKWIRVINKTYESLYGITK